MAGLASAREMELSYRALGWLRLLTRPVFLHFDRIPHHRPLVFVGNHTMYGIVDSPQLFFELYRSHDILVRSVAEKAHKTVPGWWELLQRFGAFDGSRENAAKELERGECLLLFPGGAREAFKQDDQRYQLLWGDRKGFASLAIEHAATIVPFAAVGADDVFDVARSADDLLKSPFGGILRAARVRPEVIPPLPRGRGPWGLPGIRRQYFQIMPPIATESYGRQASDAAVDAVRKRTEDAVRTGIEELLDYRASDPASDWARPAGRWIGRKIAAALGGNRPNVP